MEATNVERPVFTSGTFGTPVETPTVVEQTITPESLPVAETPVATPETPAAEIQVTPPAETPQEANVSNLSFAEFDEPAPSETPTTIPASAPVQTTDWRELIKSVDKAEIAKELGLSEFALEINDHIARGGSAMDYLNAKAFDWNKVSDAEIVKGDIQAQFPMLTAAEVDRLFAKKYGVGEDATEEEIQDATLLLKTEAYAKRQAKIAEQQKFKIPDPIQMQQQAAPDAQEQNNSQLLEQARQWYQEHEATQNLTNSKRVAINLGEDGSFNFNIDNPAVVTRCLVDPSFWQRITSVNPKESDTSKLVPNVALQQKLALIALNPNYEKDLVNYGKSLALPKLLEEGQNIRPVQRAVGGMPNETEKDAWKSARSGKLGA